MSNNSVSICQTSGQINGKSSTNILVLKLAAADRGIWILQFILTRMNYRLLDPREIFIPQFHLSATRRRVHGTAAMAMGCVGIGDVWAEGAAVE